MSERSLETHAGIASLLGQTSKFLKVMHRRVRKLEDAVATAGKDLDLDSQSSPVSSPKSLAPPTSSSPSPKAAGKKTSELLLQTATFLQVLAKRVTALPKVKDTLEPDVDNEKHDKSDKSDKSNASPTAIVAYTPPSPLWSSTLPRKSTTSMKKKIYLFTSPQCGYCKALAKEWARFTELVKDKYAQDVEILVWTKGERTPWANGLSDEELLEKYHVEGYPHIVAEISSETSKPTLSRPYSQERTAKALEAWLVSDFGLASTQDDGNHEHRDGGDEVHGKPGVAIPVPSSHSLAFRFLATRPSYGRGGS